MDKQRARNLKIVKLAQSGQLTAEKLKQLLSHQPGGDKLPCPWPEVPQIKIPIKTTHEFVFLNYPGFNGPGDVDIDIAISKRNDPRFKKMDADSEYLIHLPDPGILVWELAQYSGPMRIEWLMNEIDFTI